MFLLWEAAAAVGARKLVCVFTLALFCEGNRMEVGETDYSWRPLAFDEINKSSVDCFTGPTVLLRAFCRLLWRNTDCIAWASGSGVATQLVGVLRNGNNNNNNNRLRKNLEAVPGKHSIDSLQKTAILRTSHIIRKVLQCEAWSLSGGDHRWFKRITRKNRPVTRDIIIIIIIIN
jgi:hypothetical protein